MKNNPLLFGIIGFIFGGLVVAIAATTFEKPAATFAGNNSAMSSMSMDDMTTSLINKTGDDFDKIFVANMIAHHQSAVDMARLSAGQAKHSDVKQLSLDIIAAQEKEISQMKQWQVDWGYGSTESDMQMMEGMGH